MSPVNLATTESGTEVLMSAFPTSTLISSYYGIWCMIGPCGLSPRWFLSNAIKITVINC